MRRLGLMLIPAAALTIWSSISFSRFDFLFWPNSAERRIERMADAIRTNRAPGYWCYPSEHVSNLTRDEVVYRAVLDTCLATLEPASDFVEQYQRDTMKRFYRSKADTYLCEVTLSTVWNDDRIVGSDCYYGLFKIEDEKGIGMTDDPYG